MELAHDSLRSHNLVLNHNRLGGRVRAGALEGQGTSLVELQLAGCGITSLPARLLAGMDALTTLQLWGNRIRNFTVRFFLGDNQNSVYCGVSLRRLLLA